MDCDTFAARSQKTKNCPARGARAVFLLQIGTSVFQLEVEKLSAAATLRDTKHGSAAHPAKKTVCPRIRRQSGRLWRWEMTRTCRARSSNVNDRSAGLETRAATSFILYSPCHEASNAQIDKAESSEVRPGGVER